MSDDDRSTQYALFDLGPYEEPDTLTREEFRRFRYTLVEPPATWAGRPYQDVEVAGGRL